jgi:hypothetical protein
MDGTSLWWKHSKTIKKIKWKLETKEYLGIPREEFILKVVDALADCYNQAHFKDITTLMCKVVECWKLIDVHK